MAPKAGQKRAAAPVAAGSRKKAAVFDPVKEKCAVVAAAIKDAELEDDVKNMLQEVIPGALGVPADIRHKYQNSVIVMIGDTMAGIEAAGQTRLAGAQSKLDGSAADKAARDAKVAEAEAHVQERIAAVASQQEALKGHAAALEEAERALKLALSEQTKLDADIQAATTHKDELLEAKSSLYGPMKEAAGDDVALKKLCTVVRNFECDEALISSLPSALRKEPSVRGAFDGLALKQFDEWLEKTIAGLAELAASRDALQSERASAVSAAQANRDGASETQVAGSSDLAGAKAAQKEVAMALNAATRLVKSFQTEQREVAKGLTNAQEKLNSFAAAMVAFNDLKTRTTTEPEVEEAAVAPAGGA